MAFALTSVSTNHFFTRVRRMSSRIQLEEAKLRFSLARLFGYVLRPPPQNQTRSLNPTTYPLSVTVLGAKRKKALMEFAKNGFVRFQEFCIVPSRKGPRWLLPSDDRRTMLAGLHVLTPYVPATKILKAMLVHCIKAGWHGWGLPRVVVASRAILPLETLVAEVTGEKQPSFSVSVGTPGRFWKLTTQVMRPSGEILGYLKFPITKAATGRIQHEAEVLERLWRISRLRPHIPKVLHAGNWVDGYILFQSPGPPCPGPVELGPSHEAYLRTLWNAYKNEKPGHTLVEEVAGHWQKVLPLMDVGLRELGARALERASRTLRGLTIPCGIMHGDFAPWNTRIEDGRVFSFDWESSAWDAPILWDVFHFHAQVAGHLNSKSAELLFLKKSRNNEGCFLLYLLNSICMSLEDGGIDDPDVVYRRRILRLELS